METVIQRWQGALLAGYNSPLDPLAGDHGPYHLPFLSSAPLHQPQRVNISQAIPGDDGASIQG